MHPNDGQRHNDSELCEILGVQSVQLSRKLSNNGDDTFVISKTEIEGALCQRCRRYEVSVAGEICSRCRDVLDELK